ncbi:MAG TPA: hypothetical protein VFV81_09740 [Verrucomicrobiae bacterium]|nr:hypothetical protein [Verrucomicrobiae bacterium]
MPILLAAAAVLAFVLLGGRSRQSPTAGTAPSPATPTAAPAVAAVAPAALPSTASLPAAAPGNHPVVSIGARQEYIKTRSDELMMLAMQDDAPSHQQIVAELNNSEPAIRQAALEALKQANDRSVIPQMQAIADQTADLAQKQAIEDAIEFIELPSPTEYLKQRQAENDAQASAAAP